MARGDLARRLTTTDAAVPSHFTRPAGWRRPAAGNTLKVYEAILATIRRLFKSKLSQ